MSDSMETTEQKVQDYKRNYIIQQFSKTNKKNYENYCISRIYHLLKRDDIRLVTQQVLKRSEKKYALADAYFPQINFWIEIDEPFHEGQKKEDCKRVEEAINNKIKQLEEVIKITELDNPERIEIKDKSLEEINNQIDKVVKRIQEEIKKREDNGTFVPWNIPLTPEELIEKGKICVSDDAQFRTIYEVSKLFRKEFKAGTQCACFRAYSKKERDEWVWCPKLHINEGDFEKNNYLNQISNDGKIITEKRRKDNDTFIEEMTKNENSAKRYVFAKYLCPNGEYAYKFRGVFERDNSESKKNESIIYKKISDTLDLTQFPNKN